MTPNNTSCRWGDGPGRLWPYRPGFRGGAVDQRRGLGQGRSQDTGKAARLPATCKSWGGGGGLVLYPACIAPE